MEDDCSVVPKEFEGALLGVLSLECLRLAGKAFRRLAGIIKHTMNIRLENEL